jgi:hypothetical protein
VKSFFLLIVILLTRLSVKSQHNNFTDTINDSDLDTSANKTLEDNLVDHYFFQHSADIYTRLEETVKLLKFEINGYGKKDYLISARGIGAWGNSGGEWYVYLGKDSIWKKCGKQIFFKDEAADFDTVNNCLNVYYRYHAIGGTISTLSMTASRTIVRKKSQV